MATRRGRGLDDYNMRMYGAAQDASSSRFTVVEAVAYREEAPNAARRSGDVRGSGDPAGIR